MTIRFISPTRNFKCSKCNNIIKVPNLILDRDRECLSPKSCSFLVFATQFLIHEGWHIRNLGLSDNHPYFCPSCWEEGTPEYAKRKYCDDWYNQSLKWLNKKQIMTREELIKKQAEIYTDNRDNYVEWSDGWEAHNDIKFVEKAFIEGAKWADANPKYHWISVEDDLPCNHKELMENEYKTKKVLVVMRSDKSSSKNIEICYMTNQYSSMGNWYWINTLKTHVTHWMPLPELPKK